MRLASPLLFAAIVLPALCGCAPEDIAGTEHANLPPKVWLAVAPPEASTVDYHVHLFWNGHDPDGSIAHFEFTIADNDTGMFDPQDTTGVWISTTVLDSTFTFSADELADSDYDPNDMVPYEFVRTHTFFIRAVDEDGARSAPAYRSFTARNLSPVVNIVTPKGGPFIAIVPPIITFQWTARDFIGTREETQDPHSVRSILLATLQFGGRTDLALDYIRDNPAAEEWTDWIPYGAPGDSGRFYRPEKPLAFGSYVFAVQPRDEAGAISPVLDRDRNVRVVRVNDRITGPALIVSNRFMGEASTSTTNTQPVTISIPSGVRLVFEWTADAASYGGIVHSYRYGWDMEDLDDPAQWDVGDTPFIGSFARTEPRTFFFGSHRLFIEVKDNAGAKSRMPIVVNIIPFTMEKPLLVVDDWDEGRQPTSFHATNGAEPGDAEQDQFWADVLRNVHGFSPTADMIPFGTALLTEVPIVTIAQYQTIIWNTRGRGLGNSDQAIFEQLVRFESEEVNLISLFLEAGGKILICGEHAMTMVVNKRLFPPGGAFQHGWGPSYPLIYRYELEGDQRSPYDGQEIGVRGVGDESFAYRDCCLNAVDLAHGINFGKQRLWCRVNEVREYDARAEGMRGCFPVNRKYPFPRLELRPEVAAAGKWFAEDRFGFHANIFNPNYFAFCAEAELMPPRGCFEPFYGMDCLDESSPAYRAPVGFWFTTFAHVKDPRGVAGKSAVLGFPPVYFKPDQVRQAVEMILFDEWQLQGGSSPAGTGDNNAR